MLLTKFTLCTDASEMLFENIDQRWTSDAGRCTQNWGRSQ